MAFVELRLILAFFVVEMMGSSIAMTAALSGSYP
jgi:hypothetical protein